MHHERTARALLLVLAVAFGAACAAAQPRQEGPRALEGRRELDAQGQGGHRFLSLTLLLRAPPALDEAVLQRAGQKAWPGWPDPGAKEFAVGAAPVLTVSRNGILVLVTLVQGSYFGATPPEGVPEHKAFLAVDYLRSERGERTDAELYGILGPLAESLMSDDSTALFVPPSSLLFTLDTPEHVSLIREALRSEDVLGALELLRGRPPVGPGATAR